MVPNDRKTIDFEQGWEIARKAIMKTLNLLEGLTDTQFSPDDFVIHYTTIYNMCTQKPPHDYSQQLYGKCRESFEEYIMSTVLPSLREKHDEFMLLELVKRWGNHKVMVRWLSRFFHYLDRYFIARRSLPPLNEVGLTCFRELVYQEFKEKVSDAVLSLIDKEREGKQIDQDLLKNILNIFVEICEGEMDYYENDFEATLLEATAAYYSRKASGWISGHSCPDYMLKAEGCLKREKVMVACYLHSSSEPKLLEKVRHELLSKYASQLLEKEHSGCRALLRDDKVEDLSRMFRLFSKIPEGLHPVANTFKEHVIQEAEDAAGSKKDFVSKVIELHDKYEPYVTEHFQNCTLFQQAFREAFEALCDKGVDGSSIAELLATFCDDILKKGSSKKLSDEATEEMLEKAVKLVAYISDKDLFEGFYWMKLARRLFFDQNANGDHVRSMLMKLKQQCGGQFTLKMEAMFSEWMSRKDYQTNFDEYLRNNPDANPGIHLKVTVLTAYCWPIKKLSNLNLPVEMVKCVKVFNKFFQEERNDENSDWIYSLGTRNAIDNFEPKSKKLKVTEYQRGEVFRELCQKGRNNGNLNWIYSLGTCKVIGNFEPGSMKLKVTAYQASALLLFNSSDRLSYSEIKTLLNLTDDEVVRLLHSLSCAKYKILNKEPNTESIAATDHFGFNSKFTNKKGKITIPLPPVDEKKKVIEAVHLDRKYVIDASLVRIMKARKVLDQQQLVKECVEQLRHIFKADLEAIEERIESLITRGFVERDRNNLNLLRYLP